MNQQFFKKINVILTNDVACIRVSTPGFLVMTEKNIFVYKLFLSLNISDFSFFYVKLQSPWKNLPPLFSQQLPSQSWGPAKPFPPPPPPFENFVGGSTLQQKGVCAHYRNVHIKFEIRNVLHFVKKLICLCHHKANPTPLPHNHEQAT